MTTTDTENAEQVQQWRDRRSMDRAMAQLARDLRRLSAPPKPTRLRWLVPVLLAPFAVIAVGVILAVACLMLVVFAVIGPAFLIGKMFRAVR